MTFSIDRQPGITISHPEAEETSLNFCKALED